MFFYKIKLITFLCYCPMLHSLGKNQNMEWRFAEGDAALSLFMIFVWGRY